MNVAAAVGAGLYAVCAAQAILLIDQYDAVGSDERRAHRAHLRARRVGAVVAHFGYEKILARVFLGHGESVFAAVGRNDLGVGHVLVGDVVALDPGAEVSVRNIVFGGAGAHTVAAADALGNVDQHAPPVLGKFVVWRFVGSSGEHGFPCHSGGGQQDEEMTAIEFHLAPPAAGFAEAVVASSMPGLWG